MKRDLILLVNGDAETAGLIGAVANTLRCDLRFVTSARATLYPEKTLADVTLIVLDADYGTVESEPAPRVVAGAAALPVIVVSTDDKTWLEPILGTERTQYYLRKPVALEELQALVTQLLGHEAEEESCHCDRWGHPCQNCARHGLARDNHQVATSVEH